MEPSRASEITSRTGDLQFPWLLFFWLWLTFWIALFVLAIQEFHVHGGKLIWPLAAKYGAAALAATIIGVLHLRRAARFDRLLGRPVRWFIELWRWMPLEMLGVGLAIYLAPRVVSRLTGAPYEEDDWLRIQVYDTSKFFLFYIIGGGVQLAVHTYQAFVAERLRATELARLAQEAQLAQLTQQVQPHFLFNALNTISALIHDDPDRADALLGRLADVLRAATRASQRIEQPLRDELDLLRAYADLMTQRFADRVRVDWEIADDTHACLVPTLSLQPLLENCFHHVVEPRRAHTCIVVRAWREASRLHIEIEDDGEPCGIPPAHGVGLGNLSRRLASLYATDARLALVAGARHGLIVRVELPCVW
jgi:two-component system LytT family sensor kinase